MTGFVRRLLREAEPRRLLCVGLDPHPETLHGWGLRDSAEGLSAFCEVMLEGLQESSTAVCKPQVALFERHGIAGLTVLARFLGSAREHGIAVIADVKRGDIGTSVRGYGEAWLAPGGDFESDAMTTVAYQGVGSLHPIFDAAAEHSKAVFVLAATSNPEGWRLQSARIAEGGESVAASICREVNAIASTQTGSSGSVLGVVVGATVDQQQMGLSLTKCPGLAVLAPGFGAQGADLRDLPALFPHASGVFPAVSRSVYRDGPDGVTHSIREHQKALQS